MIKIIKMYLYCIASVILFAGTFIAIPRSYNLSDRSHAQDISVITISASDETDVFESDVFDLYVENGSAVDLSLS